MTDYDDSQWYAKHNNNESEYGPFESKLDAFIACFPEIKLWQGPNKTESILSEHDSSAPSSSGTTFPCDVIPKTRDYGSYE